MSFMSFTRINKNTGEHPTIKEDEIKDLHLYIEELKNIIQIPGHKNIYKHCYYRQLIERRYPWDCDWD